MASRGAGDERLTLSYLVLTIEFPIFTLSHIFPVRVEEKNNYFAGAFPAAFLSSSIADFMEESSR